MESEHEKAMNKPKNEGLNYYRSQMIWNNMDYKGVRLLENLKPNDYVKETTDSEDGTIVRFILSFPDNEEEEKSQNNVLLLINENVNLFNNY